MNNQPEKLMPTEKAVIDSERLIDVFRSTCCADWAREDIAKDKLLRFAQTYLMMSHAKYRPAAPSDGFGNIQLSTEEYNDEGRLYLEAVRYAAAFNREEDTRAFSIGCSNWETNRAFILSIEAARLLASGSDGDDNAVRLLKLAIGEITAAWPMADGRRSRRGARAPAGRGRTMITTNRKKKLDARAQ
jgi:hypothetical protein